MSTKAEALLKLQEVVDTLLGENGCPWDKAQTASSLTEYMIEECFEYVSAIRANNHAEMSEELGDIFFILLLSAKLEENAGHYNLEEALNKATAKMTRRHPHVFSSEEFKGLEEFRKTWDKIKEKEKEEKAEKNKGVVASLTESAPPVTKA